MISASHDGKRLSIRMHGLLHLHIPDTAEWLGLQSWKVGKTYFAIEFTLIGNAKIRLEHDNEAIWMTVLAVLDEAIRGT